MKKMLLFLFVGAIIASCSKKESLKDPKDMTNEEISAIVKNNEWYVALNTNMLSMYINFPTEDILPDNEGRFDSITNAFSEILGYKINREDVVKKEVIKNVMRAYQHPKDSTTLRKWRFGFCIDYTMLYDFEELLKIACAGYNCNSNMICDNIPELMVYSYDDIRNFDENNKYFRYDNPKTDIDVFEFTNVFTLTIMDNEYVLLDDRNGGNGTEKGAYCEVRSKNKVW